MTFNLEQFEEMIDHIISLNCRVTVTEILYRGPCRGKGPPDELAGWFVG